MENPGKLLFYVGTTVLDSQCQTTKAFIVDSKIIKALVADSLLS